MKNLYLKTFRISLVLILCTSVAKTSTAQLNVGDIAFTGFHGTPSDSDRFSFVALVNIPIGTAISFTDQGWGNDNAFGAATATESTITLTTTVVIPPGKEVVIAGVSSTGGARAYIHGGVGTIGTFAGTFPSFSATGDVVLAYRGTPPSHTFISGLLYNIGGSTTAGTWDNLAAASIGANMSFKPASFTTGTNCIWLNIAPEPNNGRFNCATALAGGANFTTAAGVRSAVNNPAFWDREVQPGGTPPTFSLPAGCNFLGTLPLRLVDFQARNNQSNISLNWEAFEQTNFSHFELERSYNTPDRFTKIARVNGISGPTAKYNYTDDAALRSGHGNIFYRLKMVDKDGTFQYSGIVSVQNSKATDVVIDNLANPARNNVSFNYTTKIAGQITVQLINTNGAVVINQKFNTINGTTPVSLDNTGRLSAGTYVLKISGAGGITTMRIVKE